MSYERIVWAFVVAMLSWFLFKSCNKDSPVGRLTIQTIKTIDTIPGKAKISYQVIRDTIHDTIPEYVTLENDYYQPDVIPVPVKINHYTDTLRFDSLGFAVIKDTVAGKLLKRDFTFSIYRPTITKTEVVKKRNKVYLGLEYQYPVNYLGAAIALQFKNDNFLKLSYGIQKQIGIGYFAKIKFK